MAEKRRFYDVWIVEANTVYREVPFNAVADWVQQGRLLEDDMLRPAGTAEWRRLGDFMDFTVYVPKPAAEPEPPSAVEPMEPVEPGFAWRRRSELEETEVDMIPLIDVSLVLLIFFMLTTKDVGSGSSIPLPRTDNGIAANLTSDSFWVGIDLEGDGPNRKPVYSCGAAGGGAADEDASLSREEVLQHLQNLLAVHYEMGPDEAIAAQRLLALHGKSGPEAASAAQALHKWLESRNRVELTINANPEMKSGDVRELTVDLSLEPFHTEIGALYTGVSDKKP